MRRVKLGQICEVVSGGTPKTNVEEYWNGEFNWITPAEINDNDYIISDTKRKITQLAIEKKKLTLLPKGTVLLSSRAPIGKVAIAGKEMYCNQGFKNLICSDEICNEYLYWYLKSKKEYLNSLGRGATFKEISKKIVENIEIKLPEIEQQRKIVNKLKEVDKIIQQRKCQSRLLDGMVQARFVEMFGDPIRNTQNRPTTKLISVVKMQRGFDLPVQDRNQDGNIPVYGANGVLDSHNTARIHGGGVITGRSGTIGKVFYTEGDYWPLNTSLFSVDKHGNNVIYLAYLLQMFDLTRFVEGTGVPTLNRNMFHNRQIIDVPINEQNKFAAFVQQVNKSKFVIHKFLYCTTHNTKSIIKPRPNTKESGKIRGGKPHADEF